MSRFKLSIAFLAMVLGMASQAFAAAPTISSFSPTGVPAGSPTFTLAVNGANYVNPTSLTWNGIALPLSYLSPTQLRATVPNTFFPSAGTVQIAVICAGVKSNVVTFTVFPPPSPPPPPPTSTTTTTPLAISTTSVPTGTTGTAYSATLAATGGTAPYTWSVSSGALPAGLTLSPAGAIFGTPTVSGSYSFASTVRDAASHLATYTYSTSIATATTSTTSSASGSPSGATTTSVASPLIISTTSVPSGTAGTAYSATLMATGGMAPYTWSVSSGALPPGLTLSTSSAGGVISGTPTTSGSYSFTAQVNDSASHSATYNYSASMASPLTISTTSVPSGTAGTAYSVTLAASGGTSPYSWSVSSGALPPGLTLSSSGAISGTPTTSGSYSFTAQVNDSASHSATYNYSTSVASPLAIATSGLPNGTAGSAYRMVNFQATGGTSPYTWTWAPAPQYDLPPGLTLSSGGNITGTTTLVGTDYVVITVTDSGNNAVSKTFSMTFAQAVCAACVTP